MRRDDELRSLAHEIVDADERGHLTRGREGGFGFVEEVEAVAREAVFQERDEGLAVGLFVERFAAVCLEQTGLNGVEALDFGRDVEIGLGAEKKPLRGRI